MNIKIPAFGETNFAANQENANSHVTIISEAEKQTFASYCEMFANEGFVKKEEYTNDTHLYAAYSKDNTGIFLNYFENTGELTVVKETNCLYFSYSDNMMEASVTAQITQIHLEDFGMSFAVRLSDGRFILFDGGREFEPDCDRLYECLKAGSPYSKPVIAAWIMTHPHSDHFHCCMPFIDKYGDDVVIEKFMFNFPEHDDFEHYPALANKDWRFEDSSPHTNIPKFKERIARTNADVYTPHTGQIYQIGDAKCEILSSMDNTIHCSSDVNASSVVVRMELGGQVILWTADASFSIAKIPERYGEYLKSDILQIPHHGFQVGTAEGEIEGYEYIKPSVCFIAVSDYNAYTAFCTFRKGTAHIMSKSGIDELITGEVQRTITLPYNAPAYAKKELERKYLAGRENCGAYTWIYTDLDTSCKEDFCFTVLNTTQIAANISIDIFFEDSSRTIRYIKAQIPAMSVRRICVIDSNDADGDALYFNWMSLKARGIPENAAFAVRFISDLPVVVSHKTHREGYRSSIER